jgi:hypothetical protein
MATTLTDLISSTRTELKTDPNGKIWSDDTLQDYVNEAYLQVQSDGGFAWPGNENGSGTITFSSGVQEYSLPTEFGRVDLVLIGTTQIFPIDFIQAKIQNPTGVQATPSCYYIRGSMMGFDPIPNTAVSATLYYKKILTALASGSSAIGLSDDFAPAIVKYAAYLAWSSPRGNTDSAVAKLQDYTRKLNLLTNTYQLRDLTALNYRVVRNTYNNYYPNRLS